jgi:hypothetical protein
LIFPVLILVVENDDWQLETYNVTDGWACRPCTWDNTSAFSLCPAADSAYQAGKVYRLNDPNHWEYNCEVIEVEKFEWSTESDKEKECRLDRKWNWENFSLRIHVPDLSSEKLRQCISKEEWSVDCSEERFRKFRVLVFDGLFRHCPELALNVYCYPGEVTEYEHTDLVLQYVHNSRFGLKWFWVCSHYRYSTSSLKFKLEYLWRRR